MGRHSKDPPEDDKGRARQLALTTRLLVLVTRVTVLAFCLWHGDDQQ